MRSKRHNRSGHIDGNVIWILPLMLLVMVIWAGITSAWNGIFPSKSYLLDQVSAQRSTVDSAMSRIESGLNSSERQVKKNLGKNTTYSIGVLSKAAGDLSKAEIKIAETRQQLEKLESLLNKLAGKSGTETDVGATKTFVAAAKRQLDDSAKRIGSQRALIDAEINGKK